MQRMQRMQTMQITNNEQPTTNIQQRTTKLHATHAKDAKRKINFLCDLCVFACKSRKAR
jgi:hypothetical protein